MKIKKMFLLFSFMVLFFINCISSNNADTSTTQHVDLIATEISSDTPLQFATRPLRSIFGTEHYSYVNRKEVLISRTEIFNRSFLRYIQNVYNRHDYSEFLSLDGTHITEFLKLCNELNLNANSAYVGMRLFRHKMLASEIVDYTVVAQLLSSEFCNQISRYFEKNKKDDIVENNLLSKNIEKIILGQLDNQFDFIPSKVEELKNTLINEVSKLVFDEMKKIKDLKIEKKNKARLRSEIIRFFETLLSRMLWNHKTPEKIWPSFLEIANGLQNLAINNIIDHMDDLDSLLWALVLRFNYFLDLFGCHIPLDIYSEIEAALEEGSVFFLESQEQDEGIKSKKELLTEALFHAKTRAFAYQKRGIMPKQY